MNGKLSFAASLIVGLVLVSMLVFFGEARASLPPDPASRLSGDTGSASGSSARPGDITYPLQEGFESGDLGSSVLHSAVPTCVPGGCGWRIVTNNRHSGGYAVFAPEMNNISDQQLVLNNPLAIPSNASSATLGFYHYYSFEGPNYDGGVLELSSDGGASWTDVLSSTNFLSGGYTGNIDGTYHNPLANRQAWIGGSGYFDPQVIVDLMPFAGQSVLFRFRFGTDDCCTSGAQGWWIDDLLVTIASPVSCPPEGWNQRAPYPVAVADQAIVSHLGQVYSFGGYSGINSTNPISNSYKYDPSTNAWSAIADLPEPRGGARAVSNGTYIYILGGRDTNGSPTNTLWRYDPGANSYTTLATSTYSRAGHGAVYANGLIYGIAGQSSSVEVYNINSSSWNYCYPGNCLYPQSVSWLSAVAYQGNIYTAGGLPDTANVYRLNGCYSYGCDWYYMGSMPGTRYGAASDVLNGRWLMAGGWVSGAASNTVLVSNPGSNNWTRFTSMPQARYFAGGVTNNYAFYVIGGYDPFGNPTTDNQQYLQVPCTTFTPGPTHTPTNSPTDTPTGIATSTPAVTNTPTETPTDVVTVTTTPSNTATVTPIVPVLVGHVVWQGRGTQPNQLQQVPITLTLKNSSIEVNYPTQDTDASGFFTVSVGTLPNGTYNWRVTDPFCLANAGVATLAGAAVTNVEMGQMRTGDLNGDNIVSAADFTLFKLNFGFAGAPPLGPSDSSP